jgi:hypothetical protein
MKHALLAMVASAVVATPIASTTAPDSSRSAADRHQRGVELHLQRRLDEASREYARVLAQEPSRSPSASELATIRRLAPRLFSTPDEPFALNDAAAILHPSERLIAYHLFWDDDIDFPDDNDPCDHEVIWIRYTTDGQALEQITTYFHDRLLDGGAAAIEDARKHGERARVNVQWGKHGSMPIGWERLRVVADVGDIERDYTKEGPMSLLDYNRAAWQKLSTEGRRMKEHAMARRLGWPDRFAGSFEQFVDFSRPVDLVALLDQRQLVAVSRWNSAVINQQFLAYNFRPKTEWPTAATATGIRATASPTAIVSPSSLDTFQLPAKTVFDKAMPRYPNVWFYVDASLVSSYDAAVRLVADEIGGPMRMRESHGPFSNGEGCDFEVGIEHLQPWQAAEHRPLQHAHAFHMRYYHSALAAAHLDQVSLPTDYGARRFYRIAASAHYEVEHTNPNHADVEICPYCGRTGAYEQLTGSLVEKVHDPLGLELLFDGTIRGRAITFEDDHPGPFVGIGLLSNRYAIDRHVFEASSGDRNTLRIGVVVIAPHARP